SAPTQGRPGLRSVSPGRAALLTAFVATGGGTGAGDAATPSVTYVPDPWRPSSQPSAYSCSYASVTTVRLTPSCAASARLAGSLSPAASRPSPIAARNWPTSCALSGSSAFRSTLRGSSIAKVVS